MKNNETKKTLTLSEIKAMLPTTKGIKRRPSAASLRTDVKLVLNSESGDSLMQIYENGFAVYSNGKYETVIRVEYIGKAEFEFREDNGRIRKGGESLEDAPWDVAVFLDGEERIKNGMEERDAKRLVSTTGAGGTNDNGEEEDMEFDAGVDVAEKVVEEDARLYLWDTVRDVLPRRQWEVVEQYYKNGKTQEETAAVLGIDRSTVKTCLRRAEDTLRKKLQKD